MTRRFSLCRSIPLIALILCMGIGADPAAAQITKVLTADDSKMVEYSDELNREVAENPEDAVAWRDLGICQYRLGQFDEAHRSLTRAARSQSQELYTATYLALCTQAIGQLSEAATAFEDLAKVWKDPANLLKARSRLMRMQSRLRPVNVEEIPSGSTAIALLLPQDLGGNMPELSEALGAYLAFGLSGPSLAVLDPASVAEWMSTNRHSLAQFEDERGRRNLARAFAGLGVKAVLSCSYFRTDEGELYTRLVLMPVDSGAFGVPVSLQSVPAATGSEFAGLGQVFPAVFSAMGVSAPASAVSGLPTSLQAVRTFIEARQFLAGGNLSSAANAFADLATASTSGPFRDWSNQLKEMVPLQSEAIVGNWQDRMPVQALLVSEAETAIRRAQRDENY